MMFCECAIVKIYQTKKQKIYMYILSVISHTTLVGMTLILVSFFILFILILIIILATKWSSI